MLAVSAAAAQAPGDRSAVERINRGRTLYRIHCASCHGTRARGDGPVAAMLKVPPPDLTRLAAAEEHGFPEARVREAIDGRRAMRAHGAREMPIWGLSFRVPGLATDQESEVSDRIDRLVAYLGSIQVEP